VEPVAIQERPSLYTAVSAMLHGMMHTLQK